MKTKNLSVNNIRETFLRIYIIQFFSLVASSLSSFVNGIITGNFLTAEEMVALGLSTPLVMIISAISATVSGGASIVCGRLMGKGEGDKNNGIFACTINILLIMGVILTAAFYFFATPIACLLSNDLSAITFTAKYIKGISYGIIPTLLIPCMIAFLQMANKSVFSLITTICLALFTTFFGLVNVTSFDYGIYGMGIATSLSQGLTLLIIITYLNVHNKIIKYDSKGLTKENAISILRLGIPSSLAGVLYAIRNMFINKTAIAVGGLVAGNALTILGSIGGFLDAFNIALGITVTMLVSVFVGERDNKSIKTVYIRAIIVGEIASVLKHLMVYFFGGSIAQQFGASAEVTLVTSELLVLYAYSSYLNMFTISANNTYATLGKTTLCMVHLFLNCLGIPFICLYLSHSVGYKIIWHIYYLAEIGSLLLFYIVSCVNNKGIVKSLNKYLYLEKGFEFDDKISISINSIEEVTSIAEKLQDFYIKNGIDNRRAMLASLCCEEMAGNIVKHGFNKDDKENTIDIFACVNNGEISIRLRDNCVPFDPNSKLGVDNAYSYKNVGIKLVKNIAKEMNYHITFGMNILTIKL